MRKISYFLLIILLGFNSCRTADKKEHDSKRINELTPSKSMYFDWININWYGGNEHKVISNLKFFKWMYQEYGMKLDIYLLDAGNIDNGPNCSGCENGLQDAPRYGGIESEWFRSKYPNGLDSIVSLANSFGCKIGLWIGPDGYGDSDSTAKKRIDMLDRLTKDYHIALFKMDACCSNLKPEHEKYFIKAMKKCYANNPELIVLNHRITLSDSAKKYTTTFLWEGAETYIDVSENNSKPAPHHRYTLERGLPPRMERLTEDHGVCLSSYLDYWQDDLILQAFNRDLILAPEIYGNPWLLKDNEFPQLARIFNLHKKYNPILVNALKLPEDQYGQYAVSRGNGKTRLLTLRNLSWETKNYIIDINKSIGIEKADKLEVRQYHPTEKIIGVFKYGERVNIKVLPFRSCLLKVSSNTDELGIEGCNYKVIKEIEGQPVEINLLARPGEIKKIKLTGSSRFKKAFLDGTEIKDFHDKDVITVKFNGKPLVENNQSLLGSLSLCSIPKETTQYFETMYFSADNNCLEARSLKRSGATKIDAVKNARDAFFTDDVFIKIGAWDYLALDNNPATSFKVRKYCNSQKPGLLRIMLASATNIKRLTLSGVESEYKPKAVVASNDLIHWYPLNISQNADVISLVNKTSESIKFVKLTPSPLKVSEINAYTEKGRIDLSNASVSNLFPDYTENKIKKAWKGSFKPGELSKNSTVSVAIGGKYGDNGAFAVMLVNDTLIGAYDRSPAYPFNNWEHTGSPQDGNYTYYFKIPESVIDPKITIYVFGLTNVEKIIEPKVYITEYPIYHEKKSLVLE